MRNGVRLYDGLQGTGSVLARCDTSALSISNISQEDLTTYTCIVSMTAACTRARSIYCRPVSRLNADSEVDFFDYLDFVDTFFNRVTSRRF